MTKRSDEGCAYGQVTRQKIDDMKEGIDELKRSVDLFKTDVTGKMTELFNHQSSRLPMWTTVVITLMSSILSGLAIFILTRGGK